MGLFYNKRSLSPSSEVVFSTLLSAGGTDIEYVGINALRNSDVFTAIRILASDIASHPIELFVDNKKSYNRQVYNLLNVKPNEKMSAFHFKFALACNMLLNGNSYARIIRKNGVPVQLDYIPTSAMAIFSDEFNVEYQYTDENGKTYQLKSNEVLHFKYTTVDGLIGVSPLYALKQEVAMIKNGNNSLLSFFKNGVHGSGILKVNKGDLNAETKERIRREFEKANSGGTNSQRTLVMDAGMEYLPLEINTEILKLVNNNVYSTKQIAKAFGVPLDRFGMELVNTSTADSNLSYLQGTLNHYFNVFTSEFNMKLVNDEELYPQVFKFNTDSMFKLDEQTSIEIITKGIASSLYTINEAREKVGLPPVDGGDKLLINQANTTIDSFKGGDNNEQ